MTSSEYGDIGYSDRSRLRDAQKDALLNAREAEQNIINDIRRQQGQGANQAIGTRAVSTTPDNYGNSYSDARQVGWVRQGQHYCYIVAGGTGGAALVISSGGTLLALSGEALTVGSATSTVAATGGLYYGLDQMETASRMFQSGHGELTNLGMALRQHMPEEEAIALEMAIGAALANPQGVGAMADRLACASANAAQPYVNALRTSQCVQSGGQAAVGPGAGPADQALLQRYLNGNGGRWGNNATRRLNNELAKFLESEGYEITGGAGYAKEEWFSGPGGGTQGGTFVDITGLRNGSRLRIQTIDTLADGVTPTISEAAAAARIRIRFPSEDLYLIPKK